MKKIPFAGLQCPECYIGWGDKTNTWDTQEHRDKYHNGKQGNSFYKPYSAINEDKPCRCKPKRKVKCEWCGGYLS